jgi:hypothetical protein
MEKLSVETLSDGMYHRCVNYHDMTDPHNWAFYHVRGIEYIRCKACQREAKARSERRLNGRYKLRCQGCIVLTDKQADKLYRWSWAIAPDTDVLDRMPPDWIER